MRPLPGSPFSWHFSLVIVRAEKLLAVVEVNVIKLTKLGPHYQLNLNGLKVHVRRRKRGVLNVQTRQHVLTKYFILFVAMLRNDVFLGTHSVSQQFDVQDLSPPLASARGMALLSVGYPLLSGCHARIVLETAED